MTTFKIIPNKILKASELDTPLGPMVAIGDGEFLYFLEFVDWRGLKREVERLRQRINCAIVPGATPLIASVKEELDQYFKGKLREFKTPLFFLGSPFQKQVWEELQKIPAGETRSYSAVAVSIERPTAFRAVALANAANQLAIVIPCHRVINANGAIGGYGGGVARKQWLLNHEKVDASNCH